MEFTFLKFQVELELTEFLEDLRHLVPMLCQVPGVDQDVIDVNYDKVIEVLPELLVHETLKYGG